MPYQKLRAQKTERPNKTEFQNAIQSQQNVSGKFAQTIVANTEKSRPSRINYIVKDLPLY